MPDLPVPDLLLQDVDLYVTNLPFAPTPLIGRQADVAWLSLYLRRDDVRLITLLGLGGVGKTRLALQVAATLFDHFADGVYFVELAPLQDPDLVLPAIVHTLQLAEDSGSALATLQQYLRHKCVLLVLDNFEQVAAVAPQIAALLAASLGLKLLVTSRSALRLAGEHEFLVAPLALPDLNHAPPISRCRPSTRR